MTWTIEIPREIQSGNVLAYGHWRARMRDRDTWISFFRGCGRHVPPATGKRHVTVTAYRKRRLDEDNMSAGFKHGRDAMVRVGLLLDDNQKGCHFTYSDCRILSEMPADLRARFGGRAVTVVELRDEGEG